MEFAEEGFVFALHDGDLSWFAGASGRNEFELEVIAVCGLRLADSEPT